jgi:hypothetical protein
MFGTDSLLRFIYKRGHTSSSFSVALFGWSPFIGALILGTCVFSPSWSGNPLVTDSGLLLKWNTHNVVYHVDRGGLGVYSEDFMKNLTIKAFNEWSNISKSRINFTFGTLLNEDVTESNFWNYIDNPKDGLNPIIFDANGALINLLLGNGAADQTLGIAGPLYNSLTGVIIEAEAILNGKMFTNQVVDLERIYSTLLHEIGHFIGLDHSQLHLDFAYDHDLSNNLFLPIMFPLETSDQFSSQSLSEDDRFTLAGVYPDEEEMAKLATIKGAVFRPYYVPVQGANVVAVKTDSPIIHRYSVVSDLFIQQTGEFLFAGLLPGSYELFIEPIHEAFWGPSGVGPFTNNPGSPSFDNPVTKEYYNGNRENGYINRDDPEDKVIIIVEAGEIIEDVIFINNEEIAPANIDGWALYE